MKPIEIFRAGTQTSSNGIKLHFSEAALHQIALDYNSGLHAIAPLVIGHPASTREADIHGFATTLKVKGTSLWADVAGVKPEFKEWLIAGRYKKISSKFSISDTQPPRYLLEHIGFLGASAPAVKGMANPEFTESSRFYLHHGIDLQFSEETENRANDELNRKAAQLKAIFPQLSFCEAALQIHNATKLISATQGR
jgi:hypothetical protein